MKSRAAPFRGSPWSGPWSVEVWAIDPTSTPAAPALQGCFSTPIHAWSGARPPTQPGHVALLVVPPDHDASALIAALSTPPSGPEGEVVVWVEADPNDPRRSASLAAQLPWAGVGVIDAAASLSLWISPQDPAWTPTLASLVALQAFTQHYGLSCRAAPPPPDALPPGLDGLLLPPGAAPAPLAAATDVRTREGLLRRWPPPPLDLPTLTTLAADPARAVRLALAARDLPPELQATLAADPEPLVRARVADHMTDVSVLAKLTTDPSSVVRVIATHRLGERARAAPLGPEGEAALLAAAAAPDAYQRWKAAWALEPVPSAGPALIRLLEDVDIDVVRQAAHTLGQRREAAAVEPLLATLQRPNSFIQRWAAAALGQIGDPRARDALLPLAESPTLLVSMAAREALQRLGLPQPPAPPYRPPTPENFLQMVKSSDATARKDSAKMMAGKPEHIDALLTLARDADGEVRKSAVHALGWTPGNAARLAPFLQDPDPDVVVAALDALHRTASTPGTAPDHSFPSEAVAALFQHPDAEIRLRAAEALTRSAAPRALLTLARDPDERVRAAVAAVYPDACRPEEPSLLVLQACATHGASTPADPLARAFASGADPSLLAWAAGVLAQEDDLLHLRFSWNDPADQPPSYRALRPPIVRPYGVPDRG